MPIIVITTRAARKMPALEGDAANPTSQ